MKLDDLKPARGAKTRRRRVGRGIASGHGKTAGRGHKGQASRSGFSQHPAWEGGRSSLVERLPKRGFNRPKTPMQIVNLSDLDKFEDGATVTPQSLAEVGLVRHADRPVKLLGNGELQRKNLTVEVSACSASAARAVSAAGGSVKGAAAEETA